MDEEVSKLHTVARRARKAVDASANDDETAFVYFNLLVNGHVPSR